MCELVRRGVCRARWLAVLGVVALASGLRAAGVPDADLSQAVDDTAALFDLVKTLALLILVFMVGIRLVRRFAR